MSDPGPSWTTNAGPETMPISRPLGQFQVTRQHPALVAGEYGSLVGIVTMENVLEVRRSRAVRIRLIVDDPEPGQA